MDFENITRGSRIKVRKFEAELLGPTGAALPKTDNETFTGTVLGVYGNHPTTPTLIEVKVRRDDNGCEIYCNTSTIVEVLPGVAEFVSVEPAKPDPWFSRKLRELVDEVVGPEIEIDIDVNELTFLSDGTDEVDIDV